MTREADDGEEQWSRNECQRVACAYAERPFGGVERGN